MKNQIVAAVILAAGIGSRMRSDILKQNIVIDGESVLVRTVKAFDRCECIDHIAIVVKKGEEEFTENGIKDHIAKPFVVICGGRTRAESAKIGFEAVEDRCDLVAIHDCARCLITPEDIALVVNEASACGAATACTRVTDSIKKVTSDDTVAENVPREYLRAMQTPQVFKKTVYREALDLWGEYAEEITDDNMLVEKTKTTIKCVEIGKHNVKITTPDDIDYVRFLLSGGKKMSCNFRVGHGYDVHRFKSGRKLVVGGVHIPYETGLDGHSDADVLVHAIMDSLLGAAGLGDIGKHFPDTSDEFLGISSLELLHRVGNTLKKLGFFVVNIDATLLLQRPKVAPYIEEMVSNIAKSLGVDTSLVNVKATTEEKLGFTGSGEGASAHAVALINKE